MNSSTQRSKLTEAQIDAILEQTERQALGGSAGAVMRAALGTLALVVAVFAITETETVGLVLLCGVFILGLGAHIRGVTRSVSKARGHSGL